MSVFIFAGFINIKIKTGKQLPVPDCYWIGSFSCHKNLQTKAQPLGTSPHLPHLPISSWKALLVEIKRTSDKMKPSNCFFLLFPLLYRLGMKKWCK